MKKLFTIALTLTLFSCGFSPMHAPRNDATTSTTREIFVAPISGTNGVDMRNSLRARFGFTDGVAARYTLTVDLKNPETIFKALQKTGDATWQEVRVTANYTLTETSTGTVLISATDTASESYTFVRDLVAAQASHNNAVQSAIRILSEKIETRIVAKLAK
ncbi:MAG: LPS assembly lipoprotein LptE [Alphaproteobacteria bacterium]|nr:LPS assembly lipoprotein LptE [Alphaproteobacteria bacterium]MCL2890113.1 LPS assembly lipoprotein LptE [Alphaproteobacteria bacterium]